MDSLLQGAKILIGHLKCQKVSQTDRQEDRQNARQTEIMAVGQNSRAAKDSALVFIGLGQDEQLLF